MWKQFIYSFQNMEAIFYNFKLESCIFQIVEAIYFHEVICSCKKLFFLSFQNGWVSIYVLVP